MVDEEQGYRAHKSAETVEHHHRKKKKHHSRKHRGLDPPAKNSTDFVNSLGAMSKPESARTFAGRIAREKQEHALESKVDDPFKRRLGRHLMWKDVMMTLNGKDGKKKVILDNVWGEVPKGQVTAIMGPSGSGKTSLLNVLAGRASSNSKISISADVRLSNYKIDPTDIDVRKRIAFVAQSDSLQVTATPRESIRFSAKLRNPKYMTDEELDTLTEKMLAALGLEDCADVLVGGALLKGISGGESKRTSVGVELVSSPALIFLDEPTSGLDSYNAVQLCTLLKKVAQAGSTVLFTIHQPSSEIFNSFDRLILLNRGRVMYQGSVLNVPPHFASLGFKSPPNYNPADWIMTVALTQSIEELNEAGFFPQDQRKIGDPMSGSSKEALGVDAEGDNETPGFVTQTTLLFLRELMNTKRNTHALKARTGMTVMVSLFIGLLFYGVADPTDPNFVTVQTIFGALLMALLANVFSTALPSLLTFPEERPVFLREYSTNHYSVGAYFLSRLAMEIFVTAIQVSISSLITYFLVGFNASYGIFWGGIYVLACTSTALGVMVGSAVENPSAAIEFLPAVFMPQILFSGFFIPPDLMPEWLAWIRYICPLTYGVKIVAAAEFDAAESCNNQGSNMTQTSCQFLERIGASVDDTWLYFTVLFALFLFFRLMALFLLYRKASHFY